MFAFKPVLVALSLAFVTAAAPTLSSRACNSYVIISTRGTSELQGPSAGFVGLIPQVKGAKSGGVEYDTVYPAAIDQQSQQGTADILNHIRSGLASCPNQKFVLLGYSQGASATVDALKQLSPSSSPGSAVAAVFLIGDPQHLPGKKSNIDQSGGHSTDSAVGLEALIPGNGIPSPWDNSGKVMDVCYIGDGVCAGYGITPAHLLYGTDPVVQSMGARFIINHLQ